MLLKHQSPRPRVALLFEFMPNCSLNDWLHPKSGMPTVTNTLSLAQRLDISVDIMDALDYLHNHCQPSIIHCDLKPSNILLAEDMSARVLATDWIGVVDRTRRGSDRRNRERWIQTAEEGYKCSSSLLQAYSIPFPPLIRSVI
jgi:serine/threonine protein kinase